LSCSWSSIAACKLPEERFSESFLLAAWFKSLPNFPVPSLAGACLILCWAWKRRALWASWQSIEHGQPLRIFLLIVAISLAWPFTTDQINLYTNEEHLADRLLTLLLCALIWYRPVFVLPFLIAVLPLIAQNNVPFGNFSWTLHFLPIRILGLWVAAFTLGMMRSKWEARPFLFLLLVIIASHYAAPGAAKIKEGWIFTEEFHLLVPVRYATGWRGFLNEDTMPAFTNLVALFDFPIQVSVIILEILGVFILFFERKSALPLLLGWTGFHIAVLMLSGICFWQWIMIDGALAFLLWRYPEILTKPPYPWIHRGVSMFLIASSIVWLNLVPLYWIDTPLIYTYRIEGEGDSGRTYNLPTSLFGPHDFELKLMGFGYLIPPDQPALGRVWGGVGRTLVAKSAAKITTTDQALEFERRTGRKSYIETQSMRAREFFKNSIRNLNSRGSTATSLSFFEAPPALWLSINENDYSFQEPIRKIRIYHIYSLWDKQQLQTVRESLLLEVQED
jgi:hypothetical protein